jgi:sugar lactone lactonase YvrE
MSDDSILRSSRAARRLLRGVLVVGLAIFAASCSDRQHANPFDPQNPSTRGRPVGFVALAGNSLATLRWQTVFDGQAIGYQIYRRFEGDPDFHVLSGVLPAYSTSYLDGGLPNGTTAHYRLYFVFPDGSSGSPAEDDATPGPLIPWATDFGTRRLLRLTPDAHHIAAEYGDFVGPGRVAVDAGTGLVWVADNYAGTVVILDPVQGTRVDVKGFTNPQGIALDATHDAWACDANAHQSQLVHLHPSGAPATPAAIGALDDAFDVAVNAGDQTIWVCERVARTVRRFLSDGSAAGAHVGIECARVAADSATGEAWVTSLTDHCALRLSPTMSVLDSVVLQGPIGVAVDAARRRVWIADFVAGRVSVYDTNAHPLFSVTGLPQVREIALDPSSGEAWVTVSALGAVVRLSAAGRVIRSTPGLAQPYGIAIDPGRAPTPLASGGSSRRISGRSRPAPKSPPFPGPAAGSRSPTVAAPPPRCARCAIPDSTSRARSRGRGVR